MIGLAELVRNFARIGAELVVAEHVGIEAAAGEIRSAWVDNIESDGLVLTGRYRDSITVESSGEEATVSTDVPYAPILEHGDSRQLAHPVAQRALDEHGDRAVEIIGQKLSEVIA